MIECNFIGFNSTLKENIEINEEVLIGAKSLVIDHRRIFVHILGIPAKKIKEHKENGIEI